MKKSQAIDAFVRSSAPMASAAGKFARTDLSQAFSRLIKVNQGEKPHELANLSASLMLNLNAPGGPVIFGLAAVIRHSSPLVTLDEVRALLHISFIGEVRK